MGVHYIPLTIEQGGNLAPSDGSRLPQGWFAIAMDDSTKSLPLSQSDANVVLIADDAQCRLRLSVALDYRESSRIIVALPEKGEVLGVFDIQYAYAFQPFEIVVTPSQARQVLRQGVTFSVENGASPWIFDHRNNEQERVFFRPHVLITDQDDPVNRFLDRFVSLSSLQPFGWLEGCVLDGLFSLRPIIGHKRAEQVIRMHLRQFIDDKGRLTYEDLHGKSADDALTTVEATLPLAIIVQLDPNQPVIERALAFWNQRRKDSQGAIADRGIITAEGMYTVAYPLAAIASQLNRIDLAEQALDEVQVRMNCLPDGLHICLRYNQETKGRTFRSWSRAWTWYMLGMVRTLIVLKNSPFRDLPRLQLLEDEFVRASEAVLMWRQPNGLWTCFLHEPETGIETSGSAGIAAAVALGAQAGILPLSYYEAAKKSFDALQSYITPDGILTGVSQHNAGGEPLQRGGYRVMSQMGMGLMAQLYAALYQDDNGTSLQRGG